MFWDYVATFVNVIGALSEGNSQAKAANFNKNISRFNAATTRESGAIEEDRIRREARRRVGAIRANVGASGFEMEGTAIDLLSESVYNSEFDAQLTRFNYGRQAQSEEMQGDLYGMQAKDARRASYVSAAAETLKGVSTIYGREASPYGKQPFTLGG